VQKKNRSKQLYTSSFNQNILPLCVAILLTGFVEKIQLKMELKGVKTLATSLFSQKNRRWTFFEISKRVF
jgi:hypothetical protein